MSSIIKVDTIQTAAGGTPTAADLGLNTTGTIVGFYSFLFPTIQTASTSLVRQEASNNSYTPKFNNSTFYILWNLGGWTDVDADSQGVNNALIEYGYSVDGGTTWANAGNGLVGGRGGNSAGGQFQSILVNSSYPSISLRAGVKNNDGGGRNVLLRGDLGGANRALLLEIAG